MASPHYLDQALTCLNATMPLLSGYAPMEKRGWGNYFRTGNAAVKFRQVDRYAAWRLKRPLIKKRGRNLRAGQADQWTEEWLHGLGLHKLSGTVRYPKAA